MKWHAKQMEKYKIRIIEETMSGCWIPEEELQALEYHNKKS